MDVMKLMMSSFEVTLDGDCTDQFEVQLDGPKDSPYEGGVWRVRVELPDNYPYKSPSIGFVNRIFHPNVDEMSGSVCLDVINQTWTPMYDLINVFEVFLPQLLLYPNPTDPLNGEAAALLMREPERYKSKIREYIAQHARAAEILYLLTSATLPLYSTPVCRVAPAGAAAAPAAMEEEGGDGDLSELSAMSDDDGGINLSDDEEDEPVGKMDL